MIILLTIVAILLLLVEACISMGEASFFSIPELTLERLKQEQGRRMSDTGAARVKAGSVRLIERLLGRSARFLGAILVTDTLVSVALSSVVAVLAVWIARETGFSEGIAISAGAVLLAVVLLLFGETLPKLIAVRSPIRVASSVAPIMAVVDILCSPVATVLERMSNWLIRRVQPRPATSSESPWALNESELKTLLEIGRERGVIVSSEEDVLWNLVELGRRTVSEVMTPRIDIKALPAHSTIQDALAFARATFHTRFPVYGATLDHIVGVFHAKDGLRISDPNIRLADVCREAYLIPETKHLPALLEEFRRLGTHVAIVVDEFGQTAGLVTLEDVLEVLFGELQDEHDAEEELPIVRLPDGSYSVDGDIDLKTLDRVFRRAFRTAQQERLSGFIHEQLGRLPKEGDVVHYRGLMIEVKETKGLQIERVIVRRRMRPAATKD